MEISVEVQVIVVDDEDISNAMISIIDEVGSWLTSVTRSVFFVITSEHLVAVALDDPSSSASLSLATPREPLPAVELANLLVAVFAFSRAAAFLVKALAFLIRSVLL